MTTEAEIRWYKVQLSSESIQGEYQAIAYNYITYRRMEIISIDLIVRNQLIRCQISSPVQEPRRSSVVVCFGPCYSDRSVLMSAFGGPRLRRLVFLGEWDSRLEDPAEISKQNENFCLVVKTEKVNGKGVRRKARKKKKR